MAEDPRVTALDDHYYRGTLTFDQFYLGAILAACGYLAQAHEYGPLGWNSQTLQLIPILIMGLAAWFGFKRIEATIHVLNLNARYLERCARYQDRDFSAQYRKLKAYGSSIGRWYKWRNRLVTLGFLSYLVVKTAITYRIFE
nr:hypothetical protein [Pseudomonas sp.]